MDFLVETCLMACHFIFPVLEPFLTLTLALVYFFEQLFSDLSALLPQSPVGMIFFLFSAVFRIIELALTLLLGVAAWRNREFIMAKIDAVSRLFSSPQNPALTSSRTRRALPPARIARPLDQLESRLRESGGDENVGLIVAVDFTNSNERAGRRTYGGRSLHEITSGSDDSGMNPYECAILRCGQALLPFDSDRKVPLWGFGDSQSRGRSFIVLGKENAEIDCSGPDGAMQLVKAYREARPTIQLSSPTTFAPIVNAAADIAEREGNMHVLVILCDGGVSAECMDDTRQAIEQASMRAPLSIVIVGIGDGPFGQMVFFDGGADAYEQLDGRFNRELDGTPFDNVHFVEFAAVMESARAGVDRNEHFAAAAFAELPQHYLHMSARGLLTAGRSAAAAAAPRTPRQRSFARRH